MQKKQNNLKDIILNVLKERVVKLALKKLVGTTVGFKAWLVKFVVEELIDEVGIPVVNAGIVEIEFIIDKKDGSKKAIKIEKARRSGNAQDYDDAVDDLYN